MYMSKYSMYVYVCKYYCLPAAPIVY